MALNLVSPCDADTDWSGTSLSIDTDDKKEGTGSLKDNVTEPIATTNYTTKYDPTGSWDWSTKKHILCWFKCDRPSTAFTAMVLQVRDTLSNYREWNLTFSAGEWTLIKLLLSTGDRESGTPPDLALLDYIQIMFVAADTTPFYKKIDHLRVITGGHDGLSMTMDMKL